MEKEKLIRSLKEDIRISWECQDDPNNKQWGRQIGILLTRNEAELIVKELSTPPKTVEK
jgi:hypothetical protein